MTMDLAGAAIYHALPVEVDAQIAQAAGEIQTLEGPQAYAAGDALVTGTQGERWPVRAAEFARRYEPVPGRADRYRKRRLQVRAQQVADSVTVHAPSGAVLQARPGSWIVHGDDGAISVVDEHIFPVTYALASVPVYIALSPVLSVAEHATARRWLGELQALVPAPPLVIVAEADRPHSPIWLRVVKVEEAHATLHRVPQIPLAALDPATAPLHALIRRERAESAWSFTWHYVLRSVRRLFQRQQHVLPSVRVAAARLAAVEVYNIGLREPCETAAFHPRCSEPPTQRRPAAGVDEPAGLASLHAFAAAADALANEHQCNWQDAVFTRTSLIARAVRAPDWTPAHPRMRAWPVRVVGVARLFCHFSLVTLGLVAAIGFATFSEWAGGCGPDSMLAAWCASTWWKEYFEPSVFLAFYLLALVLAWCRFARTKARRDESRHQDLRLLAECLRARYVRTLLGEPSCASEDLPADAEAESGWVRDALRSLRHAQPVALPPTVSADHVERVRQDFIGEQLAYHQDRLLSTRRDAAAVLDRLGRVGMLFFVVALVAMTVHEASVLWGRHPPLLEPAAPHLLTSLMVVSLAFWGSMRRVIDVLGLEEEIERGEKVAAALEHASRGDRGALLKAVDTFAQDQGRWHELHRGKTIEAATGT